MFPKFEEASIYVAMDPVNERAIEDLIRSEVPNIVALGNNGLDFYLALPSEDGTEVIAVILVVRPSLQGVRMERFSEMRVPFYFDCPKHVLEALTPTDNDACNHWRRLCWALHKEPVRRRIKRGEVVRFSKHIEFSDGSVADTFYRDILHGKTVFRVGVRAQVESLFGKAFEIPGYTKMEYRVLG